MWAPSSFGDSEAPALIRRGFIASRPVVGATSLVIGATRAPALGDGVHAVAKRGQMTGGRGDSPLKNLKPGIGISGWDRASDAYAKEIGHRSGVEREIVARHRCP